MFTQGIYVAHAEPDLNGKIRTVATQCSMQDPDRMWLSDSHRLGINDQASLDLVRARYLEYVLHYDIPSQLGLEMFANSWLLDRSWSLSNWAALENEISPGTLSGALNRTQRMKTFV